MATRAGWRDGGAVSPGSVKSESVGTEAAGARCWLSTSDEGACETAVTATVSDATPPKSRLIGQFTGLEIIFALPQRGRHKGVGPPSLTTRRPLTS